LFFCVCLFLRIPLKVTHLQRDSSVSNIFFFFFFFGRRGGRFSLLNFLNAECLNHIFSHFVAMFVEGCFSFCLTKKAIVRISRKKKKQEKNTIKPDKKNGITDKRTPLFNEMHSNLHTLTHSLYSVGHCGRILQLLLACVWMKERIG
jgi:hypothetical protein